MLQELKPAIKIYTALFLSAALLLWTFVALPNQAFADWTYEEDFEGFTLGALDTQGVWTCSCSNWDVISSPAQGGSSRAIEAIHEVTPALVADLSSFTVTDTGRMSYYGQLETGGTTDGEAIDLWDTSASLAIRMFWGSGAAPGNFTFFDGSAIDSGVAYSRGTWHKIEIDFDVSSDTYVYSIDDAADSSSVDFVNTQTKIDEFVVSNHDSGTSFYIDTIADEDGAAPPPTAPDTTPIRVILFNDQWI